MSAGLKERSGTQRRRPWRRVVVALVLTAVAGYAAWWWTHPDLFLPETGESFVATPRPLSDGRVQHYGMTLATHHPSSETITLDGVRAGLSRNTAGAVATMLVCTRRDVAEGTLVAGIGGDDARLRELCTDISPAVPGTRLELGGHDVPRRYLVWRIEASRPGTWLLDSTEIDFRRSWSHLGQRGTERIDSNIHFTFQ